MKKSIFSSNFFITLFLFSAFQFFSCAKPVDGLTPSFEWELNSGTTYQATAIAYVNNIEARSTVGAAIKHIEISLHSVDAFPVGVYTMDYTFGNVIGFWDESLPSSSISSMAGTFSITKKADGRLSGTFNVTLSDGSNLSGDFKNIEFD